MFVIPENLATEIKFKTNIDVFGHYLTIDNFGILHSLEEHGNPVVEAKRGQIAIEKEDYIKMLEVFLEPDEISIIGFTKHTKLPLLQFVKKIEDKIYVIKEVRTITSKKKSKISRLVFHTMYKIKATKLS